MTDSDSGSGSNWKVLVPVEVLEGETVPEAVVDLLATLPVVVLGYHVLPEQTVPGQARLQFEDQAQGKLDDLAAAFREAGGAAETRLVFTHDEEQTLDRVAGETGCEAILIPNPTRDVERLLVPLRGEVNVERVVAFVAAMVGDREIGVTLFHVSDGRGEGQMKAEGGKEGERKGKRKRETTTGRAIVDDAAARLNDRGIPGDAITTEVTVSATPVQAIVAAATDHDAVVMGESEPSLRTFVFGEVSERVAEQSLGPVVVVRR